MPTVNCSPKYFFKLFGKEMSFHDLEQFCFDFDIELETGKDEEGNEIYKFEVAANRYDLLSVEGLALSLGLYMGHKDNPNFKLSFSEPKEVINVTKNVAGVRPYVVGCILRDIDLGENGFASFIDF